MHSIKITPHLQGILDQYITKDAEQVHILPVIKSTTPQQQNHNVKTEPHRYNRALKELAILAQLRYPDSISSYISQHSFATIAKYKGIPIAVISEALGHEFESITQVYLDSFPKEVLDSYNEMIIND